MPGSGPGSPQTLGAWYLFPGLVPRLTDMQSDWCLGPGSTCIQLGGREHGHN